MSATSRPLVVCIGEILWDVLPTGKVLGGAPANVSWHAAQLGADSRIISAIGRDKAGQEIIDRLRQMNANCEYVFSVNKPTSLVGAEINDDGVATYAIHPDVAWDFIPVTENALTLVSQANALNFGSLAQRTDAGMRMMETYLKAAPPGCLRLFDVNLRPGCMRPEVLHACCSRSDVLKLNAEELLLLADFFNWPGQAEKALNRVQETYPSIRHIVVTRGADGMWWKTRDSLLKHPGRSIRVADTIGAGDSLAAAVIVGLLRNMKPKDIIEAALDISSYVCTQVGATPTLPESVKEKLFIEAM